MADDPVTTDVAFDGSFDAARADLDALVESQRRMNAELANAGQLGRAFGRTLTSAFVGLAVQGRSFGDVLSTLALSLSRLALNAAFKPLEGVFAGAFQSMIAAPSPVSGTSIAAPLSFSAVTGFGSSQAAAAMTAGDGGFLAAAPPPPRGGAQIVLNISTPDAESFRRSETQIAAVLARASAQGQRNL